MSQTIHAFDWLEQSAAEPATFTVLFGSERFLQLEVLRRLSGVDADEDREFSLSRFDGEGAAWIDVHDALATGSLFSAGPRTVIVDQADEFVKKYRGELERYAERSSTASNVLILLVNAWLATTRLYKKLDQQGRQIDCNPPTASRGRSKSLDESRIADWLVKRAKSEYDLALSKSAARQLLELNEVHLGLYDQQLAKLACCLPNGANVSPDEVNQFVGGWRDSTVWRMVDAVLDGNPGEALSLLRQLLQTGNDAIGVFAQAAWSLRRYANAMEARDRAVRQGRTPRPADCLVEGGFQRGWQSELDAGERRLARLGLSRGRRLLRWLYEADKALKGSHSHESRSAFIVERLLYAVGSTPSRAKTSPA